MTNYENIVREKGFKAGVHLFQGENHIKSINPTDLYGSSWVSGGGSATKSVEELFGNTAWLYAAIVKRKSYMRQVPVKFYKGDEPLKEKKISGFSIDDLARIDQSIQLYGVAYLYKDMELGGQLDLQFLNPVKMTPVTSSVYRGGYKEYMYGDPKGAYQTISADNLLIIKENGMSEYNPMVSATKASSIQSAVLYGLSETMKNFYDTNGLPVVAVIIKEATQEEADVIKNRFQQAFNKFRGSSNKTIGLIGEMDIKIISFAPKDLAMGKLTDLQIDAILATNEVPPALIYRTVNRAEAELKMQELLLTLSSRADMIIDTINNDPVWQKANRDITLVSDINRHPLFQKANLEIAASVSLLTGTPILTINEGRANLELPPIEGGDVLFGFSTPTSEVVEETVGETETVEDSEEVVIKEEVTIEEEVKSLLKTPEWLKEASTFNRWLKRRKNPDITEFKAFHLSEDDKKGLYTKLTEEEEQELFLLEERDQAELDNVEAILTALENQKERLLAGDIMEIEALMEAEKDNPELYQALLALLLVVSEIGVTAAQAQIQEVIDSELLNEAIMEEAIEQAQLSTEQINDSTTKQVLTWIAAGLTAEAIAEELTKLFSEERAKLITANEGSNGFNLGTNTVGDLAETVEGYEWVTLLDEAVCVICAPMQGKLRTKDESYFDDNGSPIYQPAHIQCRCGERLITIEA